MLSRSENTEDRCLDFGDAQKPHLLKRWRWRDLLRRLTEEPMTFTERSGHSRGSGIGRKFAIACGFVSLLFAIEGVQALEKARGVALVVGNSAYETQFELKNAVNDGRDMSDLLRRAGFEVVTLSNATHEGMRRGLLEFERKLQESRGVGLFYFSGHGSQSRDGRRNLLLPVGQRFRDMSDIEVHGFDAALVLDRMRAAGGVLNVLILDACRSERPLPDRDQKGFGAEKGLARMDPPSGSLIAYAAAPGRVALDDSQGNNSRYTRHLLAAMATPGMALSEVFQYAQGKVEDEKFGAQSPELLNKLRNPQPFYFFGGRRSLDADGIPGGTSQGGAATQPVAAPAQAIGIEDQDYWRRIKDSDRVTDHLLYQDIFPKGKSVEASRLIARWMNTVEGCRIAISKNEYLDSRTPSWTGACEGGKAEGMGQVIWPLTPSDTLTSAGFKERGRMAGGVKTGRWRVDFFGPQIQEKGKMLWLEFDAVNNSPSGPVKFEVALSHVYEGQVNIADRKFTQAHGHGALHILDGSGPDHDVDGASRMVSYMGSFNEGKFHGKGLITYKNGVKCDCTWVHGEKQGYGAVTFPNGFRYEGDHTKGRPSGRAKIFYVDGAMYEGEAVDTKPHGTGVLTLPNGNVLRGEFVAGRFVG